MPPNCSLNDHRRSTQSVGILNDLIRPLLTYVCLYSPADWAHFTLFHTNIKGDMFLIEGKSFPSVKTQKCIFFCYTPLHHLTVWQLLLPCGKGRHSQMWFHVILSRKMSTRLHSVVVSPCFDCSSLPLYFITHNYPSTFRLWSCKHRQPSLPIFPNWNLLHSRFSTIRQRESESDFVKVRRCEIFFQLIFVGVYCFPRLFLSLLFCCMSTSACECKLPKGGSCSVLSRQPTDRKKGTTFVCAILQKNVIFFLQVYFK